MRAPFWQRSLAVNIFFGLIVAYMMLNLLVLGFFLDVILEEVMPETDPFSFVSGALLYFFLADLVFRFFMQSFPMMDIQPYLLLPIRKRHLFHYLLLKSVFNVFNLLPLLFFIPFATKIAFPAMGPAASWSWLLALFSLILLNHFAAFYLKRQFNVRPIAVLLLLAAIGLLGLADWQGILNGSEAFQVGIKAVTDAPMLLVVPILLTAGFYSVLYRAMRHYTYLDAFSTHKEVVAGNRDFDFLKRLGSVGAYIQLELQQILRNKRPRIQLSISIIFLLYPLLGLEYLEEGKVGFVLFFWVLSIGFPMINYGQYLFCWESPHFDFLMARNIFFPDFLEAKFFLLAAFNFIVAVPCLLYGLIAPLFLLFVPAVALFNAGVNVYIILYIATYNSRRIDPTRGDYMNWEGVGPSQFLMILPFLVLPLLIFHLFNYFGGLYAGLASLAIAGVLGLAGKRFLLPLLVQQFEGRKYILTSNFKKQ